MRKQNVKNKISKDILFELLTDLDNEISTMACGCMRGGATVEGTKERYYFEYNYDKEGVIYTFAKPYILERKKKPGHYLSSVLKKYFIIKD